MNQKHILLIEDDPVVIQSIIYTLEKAGYKVENTVSGTLGMNVALKNHPELIICDLILPDMNGAQAIARIRQDSWGKDAKIIVLTNLEEEQMKVKLAPLNVERYLLKVDNSLAKITQVVNEILA